MEKLKDIWANHYGKLVAFLAGWLAEAKVDLSAWLDSLFALLK